MYDNDSENSANIWTRPTITHHEQHTSPQKKELTIHDLPKILKGLLFNEIRIAGPFVLLSAAVYIINRFIPMPETNKETGSLFFGSTIALAVIASAWGYIRKVRKEGLPPELPKKSVPSQNSDKPLTREDILSRSRQDNISTTPDGYPEYAEEKEARKKLNRISYSWAACAGFAFCCFLCIEKAIITGEFDVSFLIIMAGGLAAAEFAKGYHKKNVTNLSLGVYFLIQVVNYTYQYLHQLISGIPG